MITEESCALNKPSKKIPVPDPVVLTEAPFLSINADVCGISKSAPPLVKLTFVDSFPRIVIPLVNVNALGELFVVPFSVKSSAMVTVSVWLFLLMVNRFKVIEPEPSVITVFKESKTFKVPFETLILEAPVIIPLIHISIKARLYRT